MAALFAQFSFLILSFVIGCGLAVGLYRWRRSRWFNAGVIAWYVFGVLVVMIAVRYPPSPYTTPQAVEEALNSGRPNLVMLYSNYCLGCIGTLPAMRALVPDLEQAGITPILLDVHTSPGRELLARFAFETTPTYLVFNAQGEETLRTRSLPSLDVIETASQA